MTVQAIYANPTTIPVGKTTNQFSVSLGFSKRRLVTVVMIFAQTNQKAIMVSRKKPQRGWMKTNAMPEIPPGQARNTSANAIP